MVTLVQFIFMALVNMTNEAIMSKLTTIHSELLNPMSVTMTYGVMTQFSR